MQIFRCFKETRSLTPGGFIVILLKGMFMEIEMVGLVVQYLASCFHHPSIYHFFKLWEKGM